MAHNFKGGNKMTTEEKVEFTKQLREKIGEINNLISKSNEELPEGESFLSVRIFQRDWNPMMQTAGRSLNKYVGCEVSERVDY